MLCLITVEVIHRRLLDQTTFLEKCSDKVQTIIFNISLNTAVDTFLKATNIVPVPKWSCLNDYHPVSIMMKCSERLVMKHIKTSLPPTINRLQFAYQQICSTLPLHYI